MGHRASPYHRRAALAALAGIAARGPWPRAGVAKAAAPPAPWPERPVRLVVPFGPGGVIDALARLLAPHFPAQAHGQPLVVENRAGAGGTVGAAHVAQARPDGYTLLMGELGANAVAPELFRGLPYDPARAFTPIVYLVDLPIVLIARPGLGLRGVPDLIERAKARPGELVYGSVGTGHLVHLAMELLERRAGVRMTHVPYRSGAELMTAFARDDAPLAFISVSTGLPFIRSSAALPLAVGSEAPVPALPGVPPVAATIPGFRAAIWHGVLGPAGMDAGTVAAANRAFNAVLAAPEVREPLQRVQAAEIIGGPPERFAAHLRDEAARWTPLVREAGIRAE